MEWEDRRDQGGQVTPEDLCRDAPELLDELKKRIKALQSMDGLLNCEAPAITAPKAPTPQPVATASPRVAAASGPTHKTFEASFNLPGHEIISELGRGGMGVVYKARQTSLNRLVALKTFLPGEQVRPEDLARFTVEAQSVALLQH